MNYVFFEDGTFNLSKLGKNYKKEVAFYLIDISTIRKGPVFTMVKDPLSKIPYDDFNIDLSISLMPVDLPFNENTNMPSSDRIDTIEKYYSIYPLIKQMFRSNIFMANHWTYFDGLLLDIYQIDFNYNNKQVTLTSDVSDKKLKKTFKHLNMLTDVESIMGDLELILIYKNRWTFIDTWVDDIKTIMTMDFEMVIIKMEDMETVYYLTREDLLALLAIKSLTIVINHDPESDDYEEESSETLEVNNLSEVLHVCMFIPQILLMYNTTNNESISYRIELETVVGTFKVNINSKQVMIPENNCIFNIISTLLKLKLYSKK